MIAAKFYRLAYLCLKTYWRIFRPRVLGSCAIVVRNTEVLLVRLSYAEGWSLPGGGVKRTESFRSAVIRELAEECGLKAENVELHNLYFGQTLGKIDYIAVFIVDKFVEIANARRDPEILEAKFFQMTQLPEDVTPATLRRILEFNGQREHTDRW